MSGYLIGRKVKTANGNEYLAEPYIVFHTKEEAEGAADMVANVSGERPGIAECAIYNRGETVAQFRKKQ